MEVDTDMKHDAAGEGDVKDVQDGTEIQARDVLLGAEGGEHIRKALADEKSTPLSVVEEFHQKQGLRGKECTPALPFLDLLQYPRSNLFSGLVVHLRAKLMPRLECLTEEQMDSLLQQTFPYIQIPELRSIAMTVLKQHPKIPVQYLRKLAHSTDLYKDAPTEVKRQVWQKYKPLFRDTVKQLLNKYLSKKQAERSRITFKGMRKDPKERRKHPLIQEIVHLVGGSLQLYNQVLEYLRSLFVETKDVTLCTLRADFLMALHDAEIAAIYAVDPCHMFTWCLNACIRNDSVDEKRGHELENMLAKIEASSPQLGDLSMIVRDIYATNIIARCILDILKKATKSFELVGTSKEVIILTKLGGFGCRAQATLSKQTFNESFLPASDQNDIVHKFYPMLMSVIAQDMHSKHNLGDRTERLRDEFVMYLQKYDFTRLVVMHYCLDRVFYKDEPTVLRLITALMEGGLSSCHMRDIFVNSLCHTARSFNKEKVFPAEMVQVLFDKLFLPLSETSNIAHCRALEVLVVCRKHLGTGPVSSIMESLLSKGKMPTDNQVEQLTEIRRIRKVYSVAYDSLTDLDEQHQDTIQARLAVFDAFVPQEAEKGGTEDQTSDPQVPESGLWTPGSGHSSATSTPRRNSSAPDNGTQEWD